MFVFLSIDYDKAIKFNEVNSLRPACAKADWKRFLADICNVFGIEIDWMSRKNPTVSD